MKENLIVMKFGGSCLQDAKSFELIKNIIDRYLKKVRGIIVSSAITGVTDQLIHFYKRSCIEGNDVTECNAILSDISKKHVNIINQIIDKRNLEYTKCINFLKKNIEELTQLGRVIGLIRPSLDIQDLIISYGERISTYIFSEYLNSLSYNSKYISSEELILTDENFGNALPLLDESEEKINERLIPVLSQNENKIICITGFYGSTRDKKITTLGRGGTDLTASIIAYCLQPKFNCKVIYWKDVDGFLNTDPKISDKTDLLTQISYIEAKELAFFGSKVLHPLCLDVNEKRNIPSEIRSFFKPESTRFTTITKEILETDKLIKAITSIETLSMITIESSTMVSLPGTVSELFSLLGKNNINIKFISQSSSENNITFGIDYNDSMKASQLLRNSEFFGKHWFNIKIDNDISLIAVVGAGMLHTPGIAGKVFTSLGNNHINVRAIAQGSSELNITMIIERKDCKKAVNVLYNIFINKG